MACEIVRQCDGVTNTSQHNLKLTKPHLKQLGIYALRLERWLQHRPITAQLGPDAALLSRDL